MFFDRKSMRKSYILPQRSSPHLRSPPLIHTPVMESPVKCGVQFARVLLFESRLYICNEYSVNGVGYLKFRTLNCYNISHIVRLLLNWVTLYISIKSENLFAINWLKSANNNNNKVQYLFRIYYIKFNCKGKF